MERSTEPERLLDSLELTEYEETALANLLELGRTTAPDLAEATGIPKARIYGVLDELADAGYVKMFPGRPKEYQPKPPADIVDRAIENERQSFETYRESIESIREEFVATFEPLYERATDEVTPTEELFFVVDVGDPSERETRRLYRQAGEALYVLTKSFEYLDTVRPAIDEAYDRDIDIRVMFLHPERLSPENRAVQAEKVDLLRSAYPGIERRFSVERLPWRGTIVDPSMEYDTGEAIVLVEEEDIPLGLRQAAVTENASFVAGLWRYFDLLWEHESVAEVDGPDG
jgi:sugar-specific transcriptional regulator TrmB